MTPKKPNRTQAKILANSNCDRNGRAAHEQHVCNRPRHSITGYSLGNASYGCITIGYDANGNQRWIERYENATGYLIAVDKFKNVFVSGETTSAGNNHYFTLKYVQSSVTRLISPAILSTGTFQFTIVGEPGRSYTIQTSTNLVSWAAVTNFVSATGTNQFIDTTTPNFNRTFYRAVTP